MDVDVYIDGCIINKVFVSFILVNKNKVNVYDTKLHVKNHRKIFRSNIIVKSYRVVSINVVVVEVTGVVLDLVGNDKVTDVLDYVHVVTKAVVVSVQMEKI